MRPEWRWVVAAVAALSVGAFGAPHYARLAAPYYRVAAAFIAQGHPWTMTGVDVAHDTSRPGMFVHLRGEVRATQNAERPAAALVTRVQVGAVVEAPVIFWTLLFVWPAASAYLRLAFLACGIPVFLGLEAATTVAQLLNGFAEASAVLAGDSNPLTAWERWSRFIESGGRDVLAVCAALLTVAMASRLARAVCAR